MAGMYKNTMFEGLNKVLKEVALLMAMPDADLEFLANLQATLLAYMRGEEEAPPEAGIGQPGMDDGMGGMGGMPPEVAAMMGDPGMGMAQPIGPAPPPGPGGMPAPPNMDEIARLMG